MEKRVFILTNIFPPELHPSGIMNRELAEELAARGYSVKVITCFPSHPEGKLYPGWFRTLINRTYQKGYEVVRAWHPVSAKKALAARAFVMLGQGLSYLIAASFCGKPDIVISDGPPLIGSLLCAIIAKRYNARLVTVVHDFVVDILGASGKLNNGFFVWLKKLETLSYRCSDKVAVLSEGFKRTLIKEDGIDPQKVVVIPTWLDCRDIAPMHRDNPWRREMRIEPEKFVVLYAGTIGLVSGAEVLIRAAQSLAKYPDILFVMVGEGQAKGLVEARGQEAGLKNIRFFPFQPRERLSEMQGIADVSLVTLSPGRGKTSVPSKVLGYMAAARPVIAAVDADCDTADLVRQAGCGLVVPPADDKALAQAVLYYYQNPRDREFAGQAGREYLINNLEKNKVIPRYLDLIESLSKS